MIFVYPCVTSENVNRQIVPAATKCMERFFLLQLQEAFSDGIIGCITKWMPGKNKYGPILTESKTNEDASKVLTESAFSAVNNVSMTIKPSAISYHNDYNRPRCSHNDSINEIVNESLAVEKKLHEFRITLDNLRESYSNGNALTEVYNSVCKDIMVEHSFRSQLLNEANNSNQPSNYDTGYGKTKGSLDAEEDYYKSHAKDKTSKSYGKSDDYKVDLTPTSVAMDVDVHYIDGPKDDSVAQRTIMIGVKVMPIKIKNFNRVGDALLDDYFSRTSEGIWNSIKRTVSRKLVGGVKTAINKIGISKFLPYDLVDSNLEKEGDVVKQMITLAPSDFVNASAFRSDLRVAPMNYKFTSSIVMFNKDDIDEDVSIFSNRSAMTRLFKLGWTSFAVLDPVKETMLFISSLDGGYLHVLPYSYMFNTLQANDIYKNESGLRNGTRPFSIRKGNFATFARSL